MNYEELYTLAAQVEERLQPIFRGFERTAEKNTKRVLDAFRTHRVSMAMEAACRIPATQPAMATMISDAKRWKRSMPRCSARRRRSCAPARCASRCPPSR